MVDPSKKETSKLKAFFISALRIFILFVVIVCIMVLSIYISHIYGKNVAIGVGTVLSITFATLTKLAVKPEKK